LSGNFHNLAKKRPGFKNQVFLVSLPFTGEAIISLFSFSGDAYFNSVSIFFQPVSQTING
jgi:hypothetical protein